MKRIILLIGVSLFYTWNSFAQYDPGDIAIVRYNTDADDGFSFVALTSIASGDSIFFTDEGWDDTAGLTGWRVSSEEHLKYISPGLSAGDVVHIEETSADAFTVSGSGGTVSLRRGSGFSLSGGDQIIAYTASEVRADEPIFLSAIHGDDGAGATTGSNDPTTKWTRDGEVGGTQQSTLPDKLINGSTAVSVFGDAVSEVDNMIYDCSVTSGTKAELLIAINDRTNWTTDNSNNQPSSSVCSFTVGSDISTVISGSEGWRILSTPTSNNTYDDMLGNLWTQGIATGADVTNGTANVQKYDGSSFSGISNMNTTMTAGEGFIFYAYSDDNFDASAEGFPKAISVNGTENSGDVSPTLNTGASDFTLVGNPYNSTLDWDDVSRTNVTATAYVYDHTVPGYISWNGTTGDLTDGLIAPFQGFWVQNSATSPTLTIQEADKSSGGALYKSVPVTTMKLSAEINGLKNNTFFSFVEIASFGKDDYDAVKLPPLDVKPYISLATVAEEFLMDINNLPKDFSDRLEIPLVINAYDVVDGAFVDATGTVTLTWPELKNIPESWVVSINDRELDVTIALESEVEYSFELTGSKSKKAVAASLIPEPIQVYNEEDRFVIVIEDLASVSNENEDRPLAFALEQNYPNPFNPSTTISYSLETAGAVNISVYNLMGQKVATLVDENKSAGQYNIRWNAANVSSGMYYYRLEANGQSITHKMTLIK